MNKYEMLFLVLRSLLSDINIGIPTFFYFLLILSVFLHLKFLSCKQNFIFILSNILSFNWRT